METATTADVVGATTTAGAVGATTTADAEGGTALTLAAKRTTTVKPSTIPGSGGSTQSSQGTASLTAVQPTTTATSDENTIRSSIADPSSARASSTENTIVSTGLGKRGIAVLHFILDITFFIFGGLVYSTSAHFH